MLQTSTTHRVSGPNATDKTPMTTTLLTFVFEGWGSEHLLFWFWHVIIKSKQELLPGGSPNMCHCCKPKIMLSFIIWYVHKIPRVRVFHGGLREMNSAVQIRNPFSIFSFISLSSPKNQVPTSSFQYRPTWQSQISILSLSARHMARSIACAAGTVSAWYVKTVQ